MNLTASELRILGAVAALGGLAVMMCTPQPSPVSLGCGVAGLFVFGISRLVPRRQDRAGSAVSAGDGTGLPADSAKATQGSEQTRPVDATAAGLHAALEPRKRVSRPADRSMRSSVLPPSRASRSPSPILGLSQDARSTFDPASAPSRRMGREGIPVVSPGVTGAKRFRLSRARASRRP